jgi:hypothetical protein
MTAAVFKTRHQSRSRQTVQVAAWVKPPVKQELQRIAAAEGLSLSQTCATLLEEAIRQKLHIQHAVLLQPIIESAIRKEIRLISTRLALLLARGVYESGQTKRLVLHVLKHDGVNQVMLKAMLEDASHGARTTLLRKTPQLETVLADVAAWLAETDRGE